MQGIIFNVGMTEYVGIIVLEEEDHFEEVLVAIACIREKLQNIGSKSSILRHQVV